MSSKQVKPSTSEKKVSTMYDVPECYHFLYIEDGYRVNHSFTDALVSLFYFHNESMNVWSHLIGFICVLIVGIDFMMGYFQMDQISHNELLVLETYIICSAFCLFFSTVYHLFGCISETVHDTLLKLDLTGVAFLVAGSFVPAVFFGFHCVPDSKFIHMILSAFVLVVGLIAPWVEFKIGDVAIRPYLFASLVAIGLFPTIHWCIITPDIYKEKLLMGFVFMFFWYTSGFMFYLSRYPEKLFPKSFIATQLFSSHTMWHLCVVAAVFSWYYHILSYQRLLKDYGCSAYCITPDCSEFSMTSVASEL